MSEIPPPPPGAPPPPPPAAGGTPPPPPPPPGSGSTPDPVVPGDAGGRPGWLIPAVVAVVVVLVAGVAGFVILGGDEASADVVLEASGDPGADPFMSSMAVREVAEFPSSVEAVIDGTRESLSSEDGILVASGTTNALYGGSEDESVCDPATMVSFLEDHDAEAAAWASVVGVQPDGIAAYVNTLTSVILTTDTWVTNHGFANGEATPRQAVLQAGTAVMVDGEGVPRVKCGCGNPLAPPERSNTNVDVGGGWDGFDPAAVTVVQPGQQTETLVVVDVDTGDEFDQHVGARPVTMEDLLVGVFPWHHCNAPTATAQLSEGGYANDAATTAEYMSITIDGWGSDVGVSVDFGDATGDGVDDAVVVINEYCGTGVDFLQSAYLVSSDGVLGRLPVEGSRRGAMIGGVGITDDGIIIVGSYDDFGVIERAFRWDNGEFVEVDVPGAAATPSGDVGDGSCTAAQRDLILSVLDTQPPPGATVEYDVRCARGWASVQILGIADPPARILFDLGAELPTVIEPSGPVAERGMVYCEDANAYGIPLDVWPVLVPMGLEPGLQGLHECF